MKQSTSHNRSSRDWIPQGENLVRYLNEPDEDLPNLRVKDSLRLAQFAAAARCASVAYFPASA